jgi:phosphatidylinositol alpha-mannosyltransferase
MSGPSTVESKATGAALTTGNWQLDATTSAPIARPAARFRVAVFSYGLPCPGEKRGGIEQVAHALANALVARGHDVTVFTYDPRPADAQYEVGPLPFRRFVTSWFGRRITMGYLGNLLALGPPYRDFDVVIAHGDSLLLPLCGRPVIRVMHGSAREEARTATSIGRAILQYGVYAQELLTGVFQRGTVAVSANAKQSNRFIRHVIPNGIDLTLFRPNTARKSRVPAILFVGALTGRKRGGWLLDEFGERIRPAFPDAELHMVTTEGPSRPGVTYHTGVAAEELVRLYQSAWVYASPSTYEGFGLPYLEALACGTPVIATPNPGSREVLDDGRFGRLADDDRFAADLCALLGDALARERLSRAGLIRAAEYDIRRTAEKYEQLIEQLTISHQLSAISHQLSAISCQPRAISYQESTRAGIEKPTSAAERLKAQG